MSDPRDLALRQLMNMGVPQQAEMQQMVPPKGDVQPTPPSPAYAAGAAAGAVPPAHPEPDAVEPDADSDDLAMQQRQQANMGVPQQSELRRMRFDPMSVRRR